MGLSDADCFAKYIKKNAFFYAQEQRTAVSGNWFTQSQNWKAGQKPFFSYAAGKLSMEAGWITLMKQKKKVQDPSTLWSLYQYF